MPSVVDLLSRFLPPVLLAGGTLLGALFVYVVLQRVVRELKWQRRLTLVQHYRPLIDAITQHGVTTSTLELLHAVPLRHHRILTPLLLAPVRSTRGEVVTHIRAAAAELGLVEKWLSDATRGRWWRRAEGVRALGLIEQHSALPVVVRAFRDDNAEVRAAAVDAAGRLGDLSVIPALMGQLADGVRYQRTRVIDALRGLGPEVTPALVAFAQANPDLRQIAADVLGLIGTVAAVDPLLTWCDDARGEVRAAALRALGSIGLDDRSYYFALRALRDSNPEARAMAARALGRSQRAGAVDFLAERLDDEWLPASQAAGALQRLGAAGRAALERRVREPSQAGELARQMLWTGVGRPVAA
jgi:HEAT repeat protein